MTNFIFVMAFLAGPIMLLCSILLKNSLGKNRWPILLFGVCGVAFDCYLLVANRNTVSSLIVGLIPFFFLSGPSLLILSLFFLRKRKQKALGLFVSGIILLGLSYRAYLGIRASEIVDPEARQFATPEKASK